MRKWQPERAKDDCEHDWEVIYQDHAQRALAVECPHCWCTGVVTDPSEKEWERAVSAPAVRFPWKNKKRVRNVGLG